VIDTDGNGIDIHSDIYSCQRSKIPKPKKIDSPRQKIEEESQSTLMVKDKEETDSHTIEKEKEILDDSITKRTETELKLPETKGTNFWRILKNAISPRSPRNESPTKKKKLTFFEILENPKYRKFFKTFATREYAIENILFL